MFLITYSFTSLSSYTLTQENEFKLTCEILKEHYCSHFPKFDSFTTHESSMKKAAQECAQALQEHDGDPDLMLRTILEKRLKFLNEL